jgi:DHA1 family bicyclomycin/chloramphenicol resistance-like MFS transporter
VKFPLRIKVASARGAPTLAITVMLASLSMISPLSIDTFLPSFPTIAEEFGITSWRVQQIITAYLLPFACFSLVHGPLSDALGRRRVVIGGLVLYTAGSLGCFLAPTFGTLLFCRVLQGLAAGIGPTVARAVVRDLFEGTNAQRLMSSMMLVFSLAPAVAPIIGGWVHVSLGWRWVFGMLVVIGGVLLATCLAFLPETHPREKRTPFKVRALIASCWRVGTGLAFFLLAVSAALAIAAVFIYIGSAPAIILEVWGLKETQFHYIFIPVVAGFMIASIASGRMAGHIGRVTQLRIGFGLLCFAGGVGVLVHNFIPGGSPILVVQVLWFCMALGAQLTYPVLSLEMIDMHPEARGAAASVQSFVALSVGAVVMGMVAPMLHGNLNALAWISLGGGIIAWAAWRLGVRVRGPVKTFD